MRVFECSVAVFTTLMTSALLSVPAPRSYGASHDVVRIDVAKADDLWVALLHGAPRLPSAGRHAGIPHNGGLDP